ncbi:MAG TPA: cytochrome c [Terriglobales bacterium]|nr:cytochrome c [Terriglobales bacterium]
MKSFLACPNLESAGFGLRSCSLIMLVAFFLALTGGCETELRKTDAQLGLTPQQAAGRRIYDQHCDRCHEPYSSREKKAGSLKSVFKRQFLAKSGLPANDQQVADIVRYGRNMMPGFGQVLNQQQMDDLLAYLHTL